MGSTFDKYIKDREKKRIKFERKRLRQMEDLGRELKIVDGKGRATRKVFKVLVGLLAMEDM